MKKFRSKLSKFLCTLCVPVQLRKKASRHKIEENSSLAFTLSNFYLQSKFQKSLQRQKYLDLANSFSLSCQCQVSIGQSILFLHQIINSLLLLQCYIKCYNNNKTFVLHHFQYTFWGFALGSFIRYEMSWPFIVSLGHTLIQHFLSLFKSELHDHRFGKCFSCRLTLCISTGSQCIL